MFRTATAIFLSAWMVSGMSGCNGGDSGGPFTVRALSDDPTDGAFAFIDLTDSTVEVNDASIVVRIGLLELPASFTYDQVNNIDNDREYYWEVHFDVNRDGTSDGNISLDLENWKEPGEPEMQGALLSFTTANGRKWDIVLIKGFPVELVTPLDIDPTVTASVSGNQIVLRIAKSVDPRLADIDATTPVRFETGYKSANVWYNDRYPDTPDTYR